jgi:hypothetical protein
MEWNIIHFSFNTPCIHTKQFQGQHPIVYQTELTYNTRLVRLLQLDSIAYPPMGVVSWNGLRGQRTRSHLMLRRRSPESLGGIRVSFLRPENMREDSSNRPMTFLK